MSKKSHKVVTVNAPTRAQLQNELASTRQAIARISGTGPGYEYYALKDLVAEERTLVAALLALATV